MTFTTPQVFTEDCRVLNCSFLNCSSSTDGGSMLFTHDTLEIIQTEFSRSSSDQSGGSIAFRCRQAHIKECDFRLSECRHFGGAIFSAGENTNIASSVFSFSHSDGDGGSLCSTCKTATISNSRFVASISDKNGGGIWLTSTHVSIYFSLCSDCVSKTGGSSLHALSGSTGTIFQSSFIATSVDVSLLFLETNSDFTFPNCNFGVESPDHDGSDLIYKGIPNPLTASQNVGLSSSTPNNTFRPVISQLVPSLRFDEFYSVDNPQFRVSQTGEDFNCKMTHFCKTLTAAVHLLKENFHNIIFLLSGTFPTAKIETNGLFLALSSPFLETFFSHFSSSSFTTHSARSIRRRRLTSDRSQRHRLPRHQLFNVAVLLSCVPSHTSIHNNCFGDGHVHSLPLLVLRF
ncbi:hypothetical protein BLNAU_6082 [Blattamonas nauphoetae]|uniref:Uncharacterized protein n=1 Tax=Blattamonas nauphoetae TaxID=2049346 RepID=A0ABQ9Y555_9EUKA|nr:hypothetical protein BLNAU_6082 [Blattamonas nauphoetae]